MGSPERLSINQIQQREKIDPDNIHEVPVQAPDFDGSVVLRAVAPLPRMVRQENEDADADDHMQGVQAGHGEIEGEIDLFGALVDVNLRVLSYYVVCVEGVARDMMLLEFLVPLDALNSQECQPE